MKVRTDALIAHDLWSYVRLIKGGEVQVDLVKLTALLEEAAQRLDQETPR